jgi:hypothetical protein
MIKTTLSVLAILCALTACGGSSAGVGDACTVENGSDQCTSDALCAKTSTGVLQCQQICVAQTDCPTNYNCNGTTGTQKVCQPK